MVHDYNLDTSSEYTLLDSHSIFTKTHTYFGYRHTHLVPTKVREADDLPSRKELAQVFQRSGLEDQLVYLKFDGQRDIGIKVTT